MKNFVKFLAVYLLGTFGLGFLVYTARAENPKPDPRFKFGDQVKVKLPFYKACSSGIITDLVNPAYCAILEGTSTPDYCYTVEKIDCPYYDKDLHRTEYKRISLTVSEGNLQSRYHTMPTP